MIQYFKLKFNNIFSQFKTHNFKKSLSSADFQYLETNLLNHIDDTHYHTHTNNVGIKERCKSPNSVYKMSYERNYIVYQDNKAMNLNVKYLLSIVKTATISTPYYHIILLFHIVSIRYHSYYLLFMINHKKY